MKEYKSLREATDFLNSDEIEKAAQIIASLFNSTDCLNCLFRKIKRQEKNLTQENEKIEIGNFFEFKRVKFPKSLEFQKNSSLREKKDLKKYYCILISSILSLKNNEELEAYNNLSQAINYHRPYDCDIAYALRSLISDKEINPTYVEDIKTATNINPCSRNYLALSNSYKVSKFRRYEILQKDYYLELAIKHNPNNQCAINKKLIRLDKHGKEEIKILIGKYEGLIKKNHKYPLVLLGKCFLKLGIIVERERWKHSIEEWDYFYRYGKPSEDKTVLDLYKKALHFTKLSQKNFPNLNLVDRVLAQIYLKLKNFDLCKESIDNYKNFDPNNFLIKQIESNHKKIILISKIRHAFSEQEYENCVEYYENYSELSFSGNYGFEFNYQFEFDDNAILDFYIKSLIKIQKPDTKLNESHRYFKELKKLRSSYREKAFEKKNHSLLSENEKNAWNLTTYNFNTELGFGKYKGQKVGKLVNSDPQYLYHCVINLYHFVLEKGFLAHHKNLEDENYIKALEYNFIKNNFIPNKKYYSSSTAKYTDAQREKDNIQALTDGTSGNLDLADRW